MSNPGREMARLRWAKTTPEERTEIARKLGKLSWEKMTPEQREARIQKMQEGRKLKKENEKAKGRDTDTTEA